MSKFKEFLNEMENSEESFDSLKQQALDIIDSLSEEEIDELGSALVDLFFDVDQESQFNEEDYFEKEDVLDLIDMLIADDESLIYDVLDLLEFEDMEDDCELEYDSEIYEGVAKRFVNKKRGRRFVSKTKSELRKGLAQRKKDNRVNRMSRKQYYRKNKAKIAAYQKTRAAAIKSGKHTPKKRKGVVQKR